MSLKAKFRKMLEPEYGQIKKELDPLITKILKVTDKRSPEYLQLKLNAKEWSNLFFRALEIGGKVSSLQTLWLVTKEPQLLATLKLFHYLGHVESVGATIVDMVVLLLIANGHAFHIHRPHMMHAKTFADIQNVRMFDKLIFLEHSGLETIPQIVDRKLRNDIAHLKFDVSKHGEIKTENYKRGVDIDQRLDQLSRMFMAVLAVLEDCSFMGFLNRILKKKE